MDLNLSSSSSSEEEEHIMELLPNPRNLRPRTDLFNSYNDEEFKAPFRLSKGCVVRLLSRFENELEKQNMKNDPISPMNQLLCALRFYATGSFQQVIGDCMNIHKSTVCRCIHRVSHHIALMAQEYIKMPATANDIASVKTEFYKLSQFPGVIGAIDCTHIPIKSPGGDNAELYRNRKGWFSINVQIVCDANLKIMDIVARWPGSVHHSTIFSNSLLRARFEANEFANLYMLGDSGYMCTNYLLTPLANPRTEAEMRYQNAHIKTRNVIERLNGVWKRRFPALRSGMQLKKENILRIIVATAVLHNIANNSRQENEIAEDDNVFDFPSFEAIQVEELIELYKARPCLYAIKTPQYKNRHARTKALEEIETALKNIRRNTTVAEIKAKINTLRSNFLAEVRKIKNIKSGAGRSIYNDTVVFRPNVFYIGTHSTQRN
ncbi:DDE superfamily endonuclease [Popillia japonica]|uniref:Putative nuclease HARBI1 n=1 Tax=Popillia japonica TaxID=7064 RepID=A0AAW1K1P6_POPJA